ncbi:MAG: universal stress protein [Dehalococcoidia bacterium]|nr:universal stress protein [Dehalococcoidia bacterium]
MPVDPLRRLASFLVPVDGSEAAYNALAVACDVARRHRAKVSVLHVIEVPRTLPLEAELGPEAEQGERVLTSAEEIADQHDMQIEGSLVQARDAGQALVDEAIDLSVDAIVMGLDYHHRPYGAFALGRLPQYVLANAPCEVWLIRYAPLPETDTGAAGGRREKAR